MRDKIVYFIPMLMLSLLILIFVVYCSVESDNNIVTPEEKTVQFEPKQKEVAKQENTEQITDIPGICAVDVTGNLEKWGLKFSGPEILPEKVGGGCHYNGSVVDTDTNIKLSCTISGEPESVESVIFRADGTLTAGTLPAERYLLVAKGYLGYCATLPYDGAQPEKARKWVEDNINKAIEKPVYLTIGSVEYRLAGSEYSRLLSLNPKK